MPVSLAHIHRRITLAAVPMARTQHHFLRNIAEEFALHAKRDARVGERVSLPNAIFQQVLPPPQKSAISCNQTHRRALDAYRLPPSAKGDQAFAILGRGFCDCDVEGNYRMWVFTFKGGKFDKSAGNSGCPNFQLRLLKGGVSVTTCLDPPGACRIWRPRLPFLRR